MSLQENVNFANKIFDPIATDKAFLYDSYYTAKNKQELSKMEQWKNSDDPEQRKKYNPELEQWLARDLDSIKNGKGDVKNYKVKGRSAIAYIDPQDILNEAVKASGFKVKKDDLGQPYIVTTEGGKDFIENYTSFANNILANDPLYQQQTKALAENRQESILEMYKDPIKYPGFVNASPDVIYKDYAKNSRAQHKTEEENYLNTLNTTLVKQKAQRSAFEDANADKLAQGLNDITAGVDSQNARLFKKHQATIAKIHSLEDQITDNQDSFNEMYGKGTEAVEKETSYINNFAKDPSSFFMSQQLKNDVTRFSNIKSASIQRTVKEDRAYVDITAAKISAQKLNNDIKDDIFDNIISQGKLNLSENKEAFDQALDEAKLFLKTGTKKTKKADGTETTTSKEADIVFGDIDATQVGLINNLAKLKDKIELATSAAKESMTGNFGSISILRSMGMAPEKVAILNGLYSKYTDQDERDFTKKGHVGMTAVERNTLSEAYGILQEYSKNNPSFKFTPRTSLYIEDLPTILKEGMSGYIPKNPTEKAAMKSMAAFDSHLNEVNLAVTALETGKKAVIAAKQSDPSFAGMFVNRGTKENPKWDIIDERDVIKEIKGKLSRYQSYDNMTGKPIPGRTLADNYSQQDYLNIARDYINGQFDASKNGISNSMFNISPENFKELTKRINKEVQIPGFEDMVGKVAGSPFYILNGDTQKDVLRTLGNITTTNSVIMEYTGTSEPKQVTDDATSALIRDGLATKDALSQVALITSSPTNAGGQAVKVTFAVDLKKGDGNKNPLAGKSYFFPITPTEASKPIFKVFDNVNSVSEFDHYVKEAKPYTLNIFEGSGIRATFYPNSAGSKTGVIRLEQKAFNPQTNSYSDTFTQYGNTDLEYNLGYNSFEELKSYLYESFIDPYIDKKIQWMTNQTTQSQQTGTTAPKYNATNIKDHLKGL